MFELLVIIGIALIAFGVYKEKHGFTRGSEISSPRDLEEIQHLHERMDTLEKILFNDTFQFEEDQGEPLVTEQGVNEAITYESVASSLKIDRDDTASNGMKEKFSLLYNYEENGYSMEEICSLLNMKKGEVLLLKSLFKDSKR